jgi:hypothetical protein
MFIFYDDGRGLLLAASSKFPDSLAARLNIMTNSHLITNPQG